MAKVSSYKSSRVSCLYHQDSKLLAVNFLATTFVSWKFCHFPHKNYLFISEFLCLYLLFCWMVKITTFYGRPVVAVWINVSQLLVLEMFPF